MADVVMPRLSDTMEEGTILRWLKADGESVARGEELVEIETDKATMTYESDQAGTLRILAPEGATLAVGEVIAQLGAEAGKTDEGPALEGPASVSAVAEVPAPGGSHAAGAASELSPGAIPDGGQAADERPNGERSAAGERVKASPLARRIARDNGVDLSTVAGSGPGGRIVKADVVAAPAVSPASRPQGPSLEGVATAKGQPTPVELSRTQQTVARRMAESKATIPDFTLQVDVDMQECVKLRAELKRLAHRDARDQPDASADGDADAVTLKAPTYNDMVVKASALALREHPRANGSYRDGALQVYSRVNVGVAVAADGALVVPTVFDADEKSLGEIARETHTLAERVRVGTITPPELGGGTFTVSNLGMFGVRSFTAIINPPQAGILSVGALEPRAVVLAGGKDGGSEVVARDTMTLTLACDHRILYGTEAAQFLARIRELLQAPAALTL
jgi:pyruvate dehydrogenase E2 component (dihydrolipoamide acetyltransferase)